MTAASAFAVQLLPHGRMIIGIGRGDSALAHLGRAPARLKWFEAYLRQLQTYLKVGEVSFERSDIPAEAAPSVSRLSLAKAPDASSKSEPPEPALASQRLTPAIACEAQVLDASAAPPRSGPWTALQLVVLRWPQWEAVWPGRSVGPHVNAIKDKRGRRLRPRAFGSRPHIASLSHSRSGRPYTSGATI